MASLTVVGAGNTILFVATGYTSEYFHHAYAYAKLNGSTVKTISYPASEYEGSTAIDGEFNNLRYSTTYTIEVVVYQASGAVSSRLSDTYTTDDPPGPEYYSCSAIASLGEFDSVGVSPSTVEEGNYATFSAYPSRGYTFFGWSTTRIPTAQSIESTDAIYRKRIYADTTLYAIAVEAQNYPQIYDGTMWKSAIPQIYDGNQWVDTIATINTNEGWLPE